MRITFTFVFFTFFGSLMCQVTNEGTPESWKNDFVSLSPTNFPKVNTAVLLEEDTLNDLENLPYRFGYEFNTNFSIDTHGVWNELPNGGKVWRMRFVSSGATSLNFLLENFEIPQGASIYVYNNERTNLIGAYDFQQNNEAKVLSTWLVEGDDVWIEYYEPKKVTGLGNFEITKVVHGYRSENSFKNNKSLNASGACNHDVDCPIGDLDEQKDHVKKSVALLLVNNNSFCTGALINNTSNDGTPYLLTANHCFSNPSNWSFRFNWISPNPVCGANTNSQNSTNFNTISGATLKARRFQTDFCLVEINNSLPASWDVIYAGWDRSDNIPGRTFGVHHPRGDIMKVCRDDDAPGKLNQGGELVWRTFNWELGVTEGGSSGSPLFDEDARIVGQLWRGSAACTGINNNNGWDEYGRFGISWDAGNTSTNRLKDWLDPSNSGNMTADQYPPLEVFSLDASIVISNIDEKLCNNFIEPIIQITNQGETNLTSATVSYSHNNDASISINWTGDLATGESDELVIPTIMVSEVSGLFSASINNPNNTTDENPNNTNASVLYQLTPSHVTNTVELTINLDDYPGETTWEFINSIGEILFSGGPYSQSTTISDTLDLPSDDCFTFTIYDDFGDGICCSFGQGSFQLNSSNGELIYEGGDFGDEDSFTFNNHIVLSTTQFEFDQQISLYPNPAQDYFHIENSSNTALNFTIYAVNGKQVKVGKVTNKGEKIELNKVQNGLYLVVIFDPLTNLSTAKKLIVK